MGRKWTEKQECRLRDALTAGARQQAEIHRLGIALGIALEECQMQPDRSAWEEHAGELQAEVDRLRSVIERAALGNMSLQGSEESRLAGERELADARHDRDVQQDRLLELRQATDAVRDLYAVDGTDAEMLAKAVYEIQQARGRAALDVAFKVPEPGQTLLLRLRDGTERALMIEHVIPHGEFGFEIHFKGDLIPESREGYLRRRGWYGPFGPLSEWNGPDGLRAYGTDGAYEQQRARDSADQDATFADSTHPLYKAGWTAHYRSGTEVLWQHPEGGDDRYTEASALALQRLIERDAT